jgi:hypothetical protein
MREFFENLHNRRAFLGRCLPACAVTCLGLPSLPLLAKSSNAGLQSPAGHKFDAEMSGKLSWREFFAQRYGSMFIPFIKFCAKQIGRDKTIEMLKDYASESAILTAENLVKRLGTNEFEAVKKFFDPANPRSANTLTFTISESTDKSFELHVTECLWAKTFIDAKAADLGYAAVCFGDYQTAKSFNPRIELVRNKTLMQGDDCCNHRYLWKI